MSNEDIKTLFEEAYDIYNKDMISLLYYLSLKKEEYEQSDFYKQTGLTIFNAYSIYHSTALAYKNILKIAQDILDNVDLTLFNKNMSIESLFESIPEEYKELFKEILKETETEIK